MDRYRVSFTMHMRILTDAASPSEATMRAREVLRQYLREHGAVTLDGCSLLVSIEASVPETRLANPRSPHPPVSSSLASPPRPTYSPGLYQQIDYDDWYDYDYDDRDPDNDTDSNYGFPLYDKSDDDAPF